MNAVQQSSSSFQKGCRSPISMRHSANDFIRDTMGV
jgi:hypothetical protein